ncbi:MAG: hypothetical protein ACLRSL_02965 [Streptococcus sp.]
MIVVDEGLRTLMDFRYNRLFQSPKWGKRDDQRDARTGAEDLCVRVPQDDSPDAETGKVITDLVENGQEYIVAHGGRGGRGNIRFATPKIST